MFSALQDLMPLFVLTRPGGNTHHLSQYITFNGAGDETQSPAVAAAKLFVVPDALCRILNRALQAAGIP